MTLGNVSLNGLLIKSIAGVCQFFCLFVCYLVYFYFLEIQRSPIFSWKTTFTCD